MSLPAHLINEETIATLYDHLQSAAEAARALIDSGHIRHASKQMDNQYHILDSWAYCQATLLENQVPERER